MRGAVEHMTLILVTEWSAIVTDVIVMIIVKHTDLVYGWYHCNYLILFSSRQFVYSDLMLKCSP